MDQHSKYKGPREEKNKKGYENLSEEIIVENFPNVGKEINSQVQEAESPMENKPKQEHTETQSNQTDKNEKQR